MRSANCPALTFTLNELSPGIVSPTLRVRQRSIDQVFFPWYASGAQTLVCP